MVEEEIITSKDSKASKSEVSDKISSVQLVNVTSLISSIPNPGASTKLSISEFIFSSV